MNTNPKRRERIAGKIIPFTDTHEATGIALSLANKKAEQAVLGSILSSDTFSVLADILEASDFYFLFHGFVWWACEEITAENGDIDLITVSSKLEAHPSCPVKGQEIDNELAHLVACAPQDGNPEQYAKIVFDIATRFRCLSATEKIRDLAMNTTLPIEDLKDQVNLSIFEATDQRDQALTDMGAITAAYEQRMKGLWATGKSPGIETGFKDYDALTHGFFPGEVSIIAAVEKVGKTTLLLSMIRNIVQRGQTVVHFSTEMSQEEIVRIFVAMETGISISTLKCGQLTPRQQTLFMNALGLIKQWPLHIVDDFSPLTPACIRRKTRAIQSREPVHLVSVDGLWEMEPTQPTFEKRHRDVAVIMKDLTDMASIQKGLGVPVVVIHQLTRESWKSNEPPKLHHLAESAAVGRTAQVVMVLQRQDQVEWDEYDVTEKSMTYGYIVADRNGTAQGRRTQFLYDAETNSYTGGGCVAF